MKKLAIIIPAYNEEKRIGKTLEAYGTFFKQLRKNNLLDTKIIIVINNTTDRTEEIVKEYSRIFPFIDCLNFKQKGKGFAIIQGFAYGLQHDFDLIGFVDADMSTSPEAFYDLINNIGHCGGIIASRYLRGSKVDPRQTFTRRFISRIFNFITRSFFRMNYRDTQCGAKIFRKDILRRVIDKLGMTQWAFDIDLLYQFKKNNIAIKEFPTIWSDKESSKLKIKKTSIQMLFAIIQLRMINSPFKKSWKIVGPVAGLIWRLVK